MTPSDSPIPTTAGDAPFVSDDAIQVPFTHRLRFTRDAFAPANTVLRDAIAAPPAGTGRIVTFVDDGVAAAWPDLSSELAAYAAAHSDVMQLAAPPVIVPGGERSKNSFEVVDSVLEAINAHGICRRSFVLAIGGGAVLDAVGFGAAIGHRGVRLVRMPTTTLAQDDSGVGVKAGINRFGKKNFVGAFAVPWAVVNDERYLETLSDRDFLAGLSETVKVALVRDGAFFQTVEALAPRLARRERDAVSPVMQRSAELHLRHIVDGGDPFEVTEARPLDFGHWSSHKLEQMTDFELRHGEAVAIGVALDSLYSCRHGWLDETACRRILDCLRALRLPTWHPAMEQVDTLLEGLDEFREHLGGRLTVALLRDIGIAEDVNVIDPALVRRCLEELRPGS